MPDTVIKRDGSVVPFDLSKIVSAIDKAAKSVNVSIDSSILNDLALQAVSGYDSTIPVEQIQDNVEFTLMSNHFYAPAKAFILYRESHKDLRFIKERLSYIESYASDSNAASSSETDPNANVSIKNVSNLESEVYKTLNRSIQRYRMVKQLESQFPEVADDYLKDLSSHIIYVHDEASSPVIKNYCEAISLYPLLQSGTSTMDGLGTTPPQNLSSFCGQLVNLVFLLSSQCKGAVAVGEFFNFLDYFCVKDFGPDYHLYPNSASSIRPNRTVIQSIHQAYQQIVYGWNQPAGNRSYQSPFTNISYYDENYWHALFKDFYFPDGSQPSWERVSFLQKDFMEWFNNERTKTLLTFPVETMALLSKDGDIIDQDYKNFTAYMYSKGHSFFTYISDNPNSLSSCCRLSSKIESNAFSFSTGLTGVQTGSANVITLNLNRIVQDWANTLQGVKKSFIAPTLFYTQYFDDEQHGLKQYLTSILERVYKYQIAFKTLLYDVESKGLLTSSNAGYISMSKLFLTIGINGFNEAAEFLGMKCSYNEDYKNFARLITGTISEHNKLHSSPKFRFNTELVPAEGLSSKNYNWDKQDGYWVPEDRNLYNSYFYLASDPSTTVLDKFRLHGREFTSLLDGGVGLHCNLEEHLSKNQYLKLIDFAIEQGTSYFTFNIPNTSCDDCHYIAKYPFVKCPKCGSEHVTQWTRVIGFLRPIKSFDSYRKAEALTRIYSSKSSVVL